MIEKLKKYETIGACGIDCGLCPRFYTTGSSACPGCGGLNFYEKHPPCGVLSCCLKKEIETCGDCKDFPCSRFENEGANSDSFVTHKKMIANLEYIKQNGIENFIEKQKIRIEILCELLSSYNEGRSKSFFCVSCALLPIDKLKEIDKELKNMPANNDLKTRNKHAKKLITDIADTLNIDLKLKK